MQTNSEIYQVEDLKYRITNPTNKWVEVVGVVGEKRTISKVVVPSSVTIGGEDYEVTSIGYMAFYFCSSLTSITIPSSVTRIGKKAFEECYRLTSINIPSRVTSIGEEAFKYSGLLSIAIPSSVTSIGDGAFDWCHNLTSITIPCRVTSIGNGAFSGCYNLTQIKVTPGNPVYDSRDNCNAIIETGSNTLISGCVSTIISNSVTNIGNEAFEWCHNLTSITIPSGVTSIGDRAFNGCSSLTSITISNSVTNIGEAAFVNCSKLTSIIISSSVTSIGKQAFAGCESLTSITIPSSVTSIGEWAFRFCYSLTSITIPSSVTSIGEAAFRDCYSLTSITLPTHITNIDNLGIPKETRIIRENVKVVDKLELHYSQGLEFHKLADYDQAFENFKEAATKSFQFAPAQGKYAELLNGVHKHIMNNEMSQAQQAYNIYTNLTGETCSIVKICLQAGGIPESLRTHDGYAGAQYYMGLYYERGYCAQKDFAEAIKWYRRAANQGHADAQFRLGVCCYIGEGVDKSTEDAIKYCRKAAEKGHQMAKEMLEYMDQQLG